MVINVGTSFATPPGTRRPSARQPDSPPACRRFGNGAFSGGEAQRTIYLVRIPRRLMSSVSDPR
ncbi:hypothetical protein E2C01_026365 [Portunus trituberculatus]|uniref:Uncharacterized protein n=1 Tax=Portunus trituberculatus TaxID=210409 RepID=A0A5B7EIK0_PORTR|nr:hypothetical protein [Portunus trituberculatus]